jgi:hypothetical protein
MRSCCCCGRPSPSPGATPPVATHCFLHTCLPTQAHAGVWHSHSVASSTTPVEAVAWYCSLHLVFDYGQVAVHCPLETSRLSCLALLSTLLAGDARVCARVLDSIEDSAGVAVVPPRSDDYEECVDWPFTEPGPHSWAVERLVQPGEVLVGTCSSAQPAMAASEPAQTGRDMAVVLRRGARPMVLPGHHTVIAW